MKTYSSEEYNCKVIEGTINEPIEKVFERIGEKITLVCGEFTDELAKETELLVLSPGVPTDLPFVIKLKEQGVEIDGDVLTQSDLAEALCKL